MKNYLNKLSTKWKQTNKQRFFIFRLAPFALYSLIMIAIGSAFFAGSTGGKKTAVIDTDIESAVSLPVQIKDLQSNQLILTKNQLEAVESDGGDADSDQAKQWLSHLNENNKLDKFFGDYLALDYKSKLETQYAGLTGNLAKDDYLTSSDDKKKTGSSSNGNTETTVEGNIYKFLSGNSWAKERKSQTAKAGVVVSSLLTGSDYDNRFYMSIVPATNEKREFSNLVFFVQINSSGQIIDVAYAGALSNEDLPKVYEDMAGIFNKVDN